MLYFGGRFYEMSEEFRGLFYFACLRDVMKLDGSQREFVDVRIASCTN